MPSVTLWLNPGKQSCSTSAARAAACWTLTREEQRWTLWRGELESATTRIRLNDDTAWKLLFNALPASEAARAVLVEGRVELGQALLRARSVIV